MPRVPILDHRLAFPDPRRAGCGGQVAEGGDLSIERLLLAYRSGIFPWTVDPITWWSPDPRGIFDLNNIHVPRSLRKTLRNPPFTVTIDLAFRDVVNGCSKPGPGRGESSWISPEFVEAYTRLHQAGHAHSVECWQQGALVGGIYGVAVGGLFAGESMFHTVSNASKIALLSLIDHLRLRQFALFDIQMVTEATEPFGAMNIRRHHYLPLMAAAVGKSVSFS